MNENTLQARADEIKVDAQQVFSLMTDVDFELLAEDLNTGPRILQDRYGYSAKQAQLRWNEFIERCSDSSWNSAKAFGFVVNSGSGSDQASDDSEGEVGHGKTSTGETLGLW